MYQTAGIAPLSQTQVSKLLNHHSVRVKAGTHHKVGLSKEQLKKHNKAQMKGTGYNLTLDPYQVANMQYLRNEINKAVRAGKAARGGTLLIDQPFTARQAVNTIGSFVKDPKATVGFGAASGGTLLIDQPFTTRQAVNTVGNFVKDPKSTIGFGAVRGGKVNRLKKFNRWMGALGGVAQDVGDFIKPVAKPILEAATERAVNEINPTSPADYLQKLAGMGVKKSRGRPKKGGNLGPAGAPPSMFGRGKKKKAMHFAI